MRLTVIAITCLLALSGCESDQERMIKAMEMQILEVVRADWHNGIPLDGLVNAHESCRKYPDLQGCKLVQGQMQDIAITLASCQKDEQSKLCQAIVNVIAKHPISILLPRAEPMKLPDNPWYWSLPTAALESLSGNFDYRKQAALWWWELWRTIILSCFALLSVGYASWFSWSKWREAKQKRTRLLTIQRAERIEQEKIRRTKQEQARIAAEHQAILDRESAIAEQELLAEKQAAAQKVIEAAAKLAAEQAEAEQILKAVFNSSKTKRGVHDSSPQ